MIPPADKRCPGHLADCTYRAWYAEAGDSAGLQAAFGGVRDALFVSKHLLSSPFQVVLIAAVVLLAAFLLFRLLSQQKDVDANGVRCDKKTPARNGKTDTGQCRCYGSAGIRLARLSGGDPIGHLQNLYECERISFSDFEAALCSLSGECASEGRKAVPENGGGNSTETG